MQMLTIIEDVPYSYRASSLLLKVGFILTQDLPDHYSISSPLLHIIYAEW